MIVKNAIPNVIKLQLRQEKQDEDYGECLWCDVIIDRKEYTLYIYSDCGGFSYSWTPTPDTESFIKLLCRMNGGYLLEKISDIRFDLDESIKLTVNHIEEFMNSQFGCDAVSMGYGADDIENIYNVDCDNEMDFILECENILDHSQEDYSECDGGIVDTVCDYPGRAKKIASIFEKHIQPFLKANFLEEEKNVG